MSFLLRVPPRENNKDVHVFVLLGNMSVPHYRPVVTSANMYQGQQQDITDSMKQMSLMPFSPAYQQQISARKEEGMMVSAIT